MINFRKLQAVIWDMDGVLVDSEPIHSETWRNVFNTFGIKVTPSQLKRFFGMTSEMTVRTLADGELSEEKIKKLIKEKARLFREQIEEKAEIFPGVRGWLASFNSNNISQAIASSGSKHNIDIVIDKLCIREYFEVVVDSSALPSKPNPIIFSKAAEALNVIPLNCLVIEDSVAGVQAAKAAGMKCVAVATTNPKNKLSDADIVVENLGSLEIAQITDLFIA